MSEKIKEVLKNDKFAIKANIKLNGSDKHHLVPEWKVEQGASLVRIKPAADWCEVETLDCGSVVISASVNDITHPVSTSFGFNIVDPEEKKATISVEVFPSLKEKAKKDHDEKKAHEKAAHDKKVADEKKAHDKKVAEEKAAHDKKVADEKKAHEKKVAEEKAAAEKKKVEVKK